MAYRAPAFAGVLLTLISEKQGDEIYDPLPPNLIADLSPNDAKIRVWLSILSFAVVMGLLIRGVCVNEFHRVRRILVSHHILRSLVRSYTKWSSFLSSYASFQCLLVR